MREKRAKLITNRLLNAQVTFVFLFLKKYSKLKRNPRRYHVVH